MDDDTMPPHTRVTIECGQVSISVETSVGWTPEQVDDSLTRMRRALVATIRQLGLVETPDE